MGLMGVVGFLVGDALAGVIGYAPFWAMERPHTLGGRYGLMVVIVSDLFTGCRITLHLGAFSCPLH